ncbi:MAG: hypothetical protein JWM80_4955 [Cyanobacteria bacterium RYN_339]|nr:hypothetical protein [Cyanobacteria bacterium RYN_339]
MLPPCPPAWVQAHTPTPAFWDYERLSAEEQRVLAFKGGPAAYYVLAKEHPRWLANFLNQAAALEARRFPDGRTGLSFVKGVERYDHDRSWLLVDPDLHAHVCKDASLLPWHKTAFRGPENSSFFHAAYGQCFRENVQGASQQLSFHPASGYAKLEVDIDEECPTSGSVALAWGHLWRVAVNHVTPNHASPMETNAFEIYRLLARRGIHPHYDLKFD